MNYPKTTLGKAHVRLRNTLGTITGWLKSVFIALDQLANALTGGWADETLSSRAYRMAVDGTTWPMRTIDTIFFWEKGHCEQAFDSERKRLQSPPEVRMG